MVRCVNMLYPPLLTLNLCRDFKYGQLWSSATFKRFKIEAYYLRCNCCPWKELSKNVRHGAVTPRDVPRCQICCVLELFFVHSNFPFLLLPSSLSSPTSSLSPFSPPLLFPKRWTRNLAIADRIRSAWWKHPQGNTDIEHILYLSVRPV